MPSQNLPCPLLGPPLLKPPTPSQRTSQMHPLQDQDTNRTPSLLNTQATHFSETPLTNSPMASANAGGENEKESEEEAIRQVMKLVKDEVATLSRTFHKNERYFLTRLHFTSKVDRQSRVPNQWNAFLHHQAQERNEGKVHC